MGSVNCVVFACGGGVGWFEFFIALAVSVGVSWVIVATCQGIFGRDKETILRSCAERNICFECKYDLRGLTTDFCPECGTKPPKVLLREMELQSRSTLVPRS